jgi:hypothetical protein
MGRFSAEFIDPDFKSIYVCKKCSVHLAKRQDIISRAFQGHSGKAYLFEHVLNYYTGNAANKMLMSGIHKIRDVFCLSCDTKIGWTYDEAYEQAQKYKEGKFVLERAHIRFKLRKSAEEIIALLGIHDDEVAFETPLERLRGEEDSDVEE